MGLKVGAERALIAERDRLRAENKKLREALAYWFPDESWMMEMHPNHKHEAWGIFYEHLPLLKEKS